LEIKGTEDGNVEEEAVVNFRAYMDGLAAEELVLELWTWRQFHCDCVNSKFGVGIWRLQANKEPENSCNIYNQNYKFPKDEEGEPVYD